MMRLDLAEDLIEIIVRGGVAEAGDEPPHQPRDAPALSGETGLRGRSRAADDHLIAYDDHGGARPRSNGVLSIVGCGRSSCDHMTLPLIQLTRTILWAH